MTPSPAPVASLAAARRSAAKTKTPPSNTELQEAYFKLLEYVDEQDERITSLENRLLKLIQDLKAAIFPGPKSSGQ